MEEGRGDVRREGGTLKKEPKMREPENKPTKRGKGEHPEGKEGARTAIEQHRESRRQITQKTNGSVSEGARKGRVTDKARRQAQEGKAASKAKTRRKGVARAPRHKDKQRGNAEGDQPRKVFDKRLQANESDSQRGCFERAGKRKERANSGRHFAQLVLQQASGAERGARGWRITDDRREDGRPEG